MKVLIAIDSFKGNLSSLEVAAVVEDGIRMVYPEALVEKVAIADGGEGTMKTIVDYFHGEFIGISVVGPNGLPVKAKYGIIQNTIAVMEMAEASGITLVKKSELNPLKTTTFGTGQMIYDALEMGCNKIIMGIGGSATNDGGQGMAAALGVKFFDALDRPIGLGGEVLSQITDLDTSGLDPRLKEIEFIVACDVDNPLCGELGASWVFGSQKGATPEMIIALDLGLANFAEVIKRKTGIEIASIPGSGAAGGLGGGLIAFCNAKLSSGIEIVMDTLEVERRIKEADIVITGEGCVDRQTANGKVPAGIAGCAKRYGKPVFAITGYEGDGASDVYRCGIDAVISSITAPIDNEEAIRKSIPMLRNAAERLFRILRAVGIK
jgi:glycerate kinase